MLSEIGFFGNSSEVRDFVVYPASVETHGEVRVSAHGRCCTSLSCPDSRICARDVLSRLEPLETK